MDLALNNLQRLVCHKNPNSKPTKQMTCLIELFEIELYLHLFVCKQMTDV